MITVVQRSGFSSWGCIMRSKQAIPQILFQLLLGIFLVVTVALPSMAAVTIDNVTVAESGTMTFTATSSSGSPSFTVDVVFGGGTATGGATDYDSTTQSLSFTGFAGETKTFIVPLNDDSIVEGTETFNVSMQNIVPAGTTDISDTAIGTITDNDQATVTIGDVSVDESGTISFTAAVDNAVQGGFTVDISFADGTAIGGNVDYNSAPQTLTFAGTIGETQPFTVTLNDDTIVESSETFTVTQTSGNGDIITTDTATGTITDTDQATVTISDVSVDESGTMNFSALVDNAVQDGFTVDITFTDGTAAGGGVDYDSAPQTLTFAGTVGEIQPFTVTLNNDTIVEPSESFTVSQSSTHSGIMTTDTAIGTITDGDQATVTIGDVSVDESGAMSFTATVDNEVVGGFSVDISFADGTASGSGVDYDSAPQTLTFAGTAGETQPIPVTLNDDSIVESSETFTVNQSSTNSDIITTDAATGTITNSDQATVTIGDVSVNESGTMGFTATVDNAVDGGFSVDISFADVTATGGGTDYNSTPQTLTFAGTIGETQPFTVPLINDSLVETDETFTVNQSSANGSIITTDTATGTITDTDTSTVFLAATTAPAEPATDGIFTVTLSNKSSTDTVVNYSVSGTAWSGIDYAALSGTATVSANSSSAFITVPIIDDLVVEGPETLEITLTGTDNPKIAISATPFDTAGVIFGENDSAVVTLENVSVLENGTMQFTATVDLAVSGGFTVDTFFNDGLATGGAPLAAGIDFDNSAQTLTFLGNTGETQSFIVPLNNDGVVEPAEDFLVYLDNLVPAEAPVAMFDLTDTATGTILNDDHLITMTTDQYGHITGSLGGDADGSVGPATDTVIVAHNSQPIFSMFSASSCYHISGVQVNGTPESEDFSSYDETMSYSYTFPPVTTEDQSINLDMAINEYTITTVILGNNGTVTPTMTLNCGADSPDILVQANSGYHITWVKVDNVIQPAAYGLTAYTVPAFVSVSGSHTVEAAFTQMITIQEVSPFGGITPAGTGDPALYEVDYNSTPSFDILAADPCPDSLAHNGLKHYISDILIDNVSIGTVQGTDTDSYTYTFSPVISEHTIEVLFTAYVDVTINGPGQVEYNANIVSSPGGVTAGSIEVESGVDAEFVITPATGYHIDSVLIDNTEDPGRTSNYTFEDMKDEDHSLAVTFDIDTFVIEPVSTYGTIYNDAAETVPASISYPDFNTSTSYYIDLNDPDHAVRGVLVDNLPIIMPTIGNSVTDINGEWTASNVGDDYLHVQFTAIKSSHRLEALDYDTNPISDIPLAAAAVSAPANVMFIFDDSGSMSWSVMTTSGNEGKYYINGTGYTGVFTDWKIPNAYRMEWKSQWHEYNRMYYNPKVDYVPWPRVVKLSQDIHAVNTSWDIRTDANADTKDPRLHPLDNSHLLHLRNQFAILGGGTYTPDADDIIIDDEDAGWTQCGSTYNENGQGGYNNDYRELRISTSSCNPPYASWTPTIPSADTYYVYTQWQGESDSYRNVCYTVNYDGGSQEICGFDHTADSPGWVLLGTYSFAGGTTGSVVVTNATDPSMSGSEVNADAVLFSKNPLPVSVVIPYAHYYVWSETESAPYLVVFDHVNSKLDYYKATGTNMDKGLDNHDDFVTDLVLDTTPPADVATDDDYATALQNFANWVTYYHERRLAAVSAVSRSLVLMEGVQAGLYTLWERITLPVQKIKVGGVDKTDDFLFELYQMPASGGTPLRRALDRIGKYYDMTEGKYSSYLGANAPWADAEDGGECQQAFAILMTDGYWNSDDAQTSAARNADNDNTTPVDSGGDTIYADADTSTVADVAMYYYERDLVPDRTDTSGNPVTCAVPPCLDDRIVPSPEDTPTHDDPANWQHMVTYGVSFGLVGNLDQDYYMKPYKVDSTATRIQVDNPERDYPNWPNVSANNLSTVDDLFHAGVNGRGGFFNAANPDDLVKSLVGIVNNISKRTGSAASVSVNGDELYETISADTRMFQSEYNTDSWYGDLKAFTLDPGTGQVADIHLWSAGEKMKAFLSSTDPLKGPANRNIFTHNQANGVTFEWANLSTLEQKFLEPYFAPARSGQDVLDYIRGVSTYEPGGVFRNRIEPFGDFVHSQASYEDGVLYIGGNDGMLHAFYADDLKGGEEVFAYIPSFVYPNLRDLADPAYRHEYYVDSTPFVEKIEKDGSSRTLLIGGLGKGGKGIYALDISDPANFDATDVLWEFPESALPIASGTTFAFVDKGAGSHDEIQDSAGGLGAVNVGDFISVAGADCSGATTGSNNGTYEVLAASAGVLEVATGSLLNSCGDGQNVSILPASSDPDMGYSFSTPVLVRSNDKQINNGTLLESWVVIVGNGYSSDTGKVALYILNPLDGSLIRKIDAGVGPLNGLSTPKIIDVNNDLRADYVYAGDLQGNMWKFDLTAGRGNQMDMSNPDICTDMSKCYEDWQVAFCDEVTDSGDCNAVDAIPQPLFSGNLNQAITAAPDIMFHSESPGYMVIFGTGKYLGLSDLMSMDTQSLYGIWDWAPDSYDAGYLGARIDDTTVVPPVATLSHAPIRDASDDPVNTLLRQETWVEGELTEDTDGDGHLDCGEDLNCDGVFDAGEDQNGNGLLDLKEDVNGNNTLDANEDFDGDGHLDTHEDTNDNGTIDIYSYYRIPSNYEGDWSMVEAIFDVDGDGTIGNNGDGVVKYGETDLLPKMNLGWYYDLPGKIMDHDNVDNDGDGTTDETGEHALGERVISDAIIRDGRAILLSFGMTGSTCSAGTYSFVNERNADTGGMNMKPVFDLNGDGEVNQKDLVMITVDTDGDGVPDTDIPGIPGDKSFDGHIYNPAILREGGNDDDPEETKYFSSSGGVIETMTESGERRGVYLWMQVE